MTKDAKIEDLQVSNAFFVNPILSPPTSTPARHREPGESGQPRRQIIESRHWAEFITRIPKLNKQGGKGLSTQDQQYAHIAVINGVCEQVTNLNALQQRLI